MRHLVISIHLQAPSYISEGTLVYIHAACISYYHHFAL